MCNIEKSQLLNVTLLETPQFNVSPVGHLFLKEKNANSIRQQAIGLDILYYC